MSECQTITIAGILSEMGFSIPDNLGDYLDVLEDALVEAYEYVRIKKTRLEANAIRKSAKKLNKQECKICGCAQTITQHHIIPVCLGGTNNSENLAWLCSDCHKQVHRRKIYNKTDFDKFVTECKGGQTNE